MDWQINDTFRRVLAHLQEIENDPQDKRLDQALLRDGESSLNHSTPKRVAWDLLLQGERLLTILQEDPRPLTRLLEKDISLIPFEEVKDTIPSTKLEQGLISPIVSIQLLCLSYIERAADTPSGTAWVGSNESLSRHLITTWLSSPSTEVADKSLDVIVALLTVDHPRSKTLVTEKHQRGEAEGLGLLWRRIFHDQDTYEILFLWTSLKSSEYGERNKKAHQTATTAQGRLFDFITRVSELDWTDITTSHFPHVEARYGHGLSSDQKGTSLLQYAATRMVDLSDPLMSFIRRDFFAKLLAQIEARNEFRQIPPRLLETMKEDIGDEIESSAQAA